MRVWDGEGRSSQWSSHGHVVHGRAASTPSGMAAGSASPRPADVKEGTPLPFPWLRKTFTLKQKPRQATAYVNALGYYELYINGKKVDDHVLSPAVSDFSKRNLYVTHDVTSYLVQGNNCVALWLGRGWYVRGHPGVIHDGPLVRAQMDVSLPDGTTAKMGTDATWKVRESPLTPLGKGTAFGDYGGERYDARLELAAGTRRQLDDSGWKPAALFDSAAGHHGRADGRAQPDHPDLKPVKVQEILAGRLHDRHGAELHRLVRAAHPGRPGGRLDGAAGVRRFSAVRNPLLRRTTSAMKSSRSGSGAGVPLAVQLSRFRLGSHHGPGAARPPLDDVKGHLIHTGYERGRRVRILERPDEPDLPDGRPGPTSA